MKIINELINKSSNVPDPEKRILGIEGSPRKGGNSDVLLSQMLKGAEANKTDFTKIHLRDIDFKGCIGCEKCRKDKVCTGLKDGMSLIYPDFLSSKGLILISPTHNYNLTAWMKAFIDRLYCFYDFDSNCPRGWSSRISGQKRKAVIAAVCEQESKKDMGFTLDAMRIPLEAHGFEIIDELPVFKIFDKAKVKENPEVMDKAFNLGKRLGESL
ncbi:MAG: flavodoxin family protein [Thermodesulfobacteriota bacterium]